MSNKNKAKGTRAESRVVKYLKEHGLNAERQPLKGNKDEGDIKIEFEEGYTWILEVKTGKQTENPSRKQIQEWSQQTITERDNANAQAGFLIVVRHNRKLIDADVYHMFGDNKQRTMHMYFDNWVDRIK